MNRNFWAAILSAVVFSASASVSASEEDTAKTPAATQPTIRTITAEDQQRFNDRLNNISPEDQQRLNERLKSVEAASKAQAEQASEGAEEANPVCEVVLCLFGKMNGASQDECKSAEEEYFSILSKKKGKIRWGQTAKKRLEFLDGCPSPENDKINDKFGKILG